MTTITSTTTTVEETTAPMPSKSAKDVAIELIMAETGCTADNAKTGLNFIKMMAGHARGAVRKPYDVPGTHHLTWKEMSLIGYEVMDAIMPHGVMAADGSAHQAVEAIVLKPELGEYALTHDNPTGNAEDCIVCVNVQAV